MSTKDPGRPADEAVPREVRKVTDARTLRALAHPVRIALLEALLHGGAQTATEAGERIGESPTTCSFHLRQLGKDGVVGEGGRRPGPGAALAADVDRHVARPGQRRPGGAGRVPGGAAPVPGAPAGPVRD